MSDLYVAQLQDEIPLSQVIGVPATATTERALVLRGRGFDRVVEVAVNDQSIVSGWTLRHNTELYVPLPSLLRTATIVSVAAYSDTAHDMQSSRIQFRIGSGVRVEGVQLVVQLLVRWLFTDTGTDAWNPEAGGGWQKALRYVKDRDDYMSVIPDLVEGLRRVVSYIQNIQSRDPGIRPDERLASAEIVRTAKVPRGIRIVLEVKTVGEDRALFAVRR